MKALRYFIAIFFVFISCEDDYQQVNFEFYSIKNNYTANITTSIDKALGRKDRINNINSNIEKAIINSIYPSENITNLTTALQKFDDDYTAFKRDFPDVEPVWELHLETEISYQSPYIISIAINTYRYEGGAHGNDEILFLNLNANTGQVLQHKELLKNIEGFKTLAESYFVKNLETKDANLKMEDYFFGDPFQLPENIGFSDEGVILLYNVYEVASYAQGHTEFIIPFKEAEPFLNYY